MSILLIILLVLVVGCSSQQPGLYRRQVLLSDQLTASAVSLRVPSDQEMFLLSDAVLKIYSGRSTNAHVTELIGSGILTGISAATVIAANSHASSSTSAVLATIGAFIGNILGLVDPPNRMFALSGGAALIRDAQSDFFECATTKGSFVWAAGLSGCGAVLYGSVSSAVNVTEAAINGSIPRQQDMNRFRARNPTTAATVP